MVRAFPGLKNHLMKRAFGRSSCAKPFNCLVIIDLRCSSTVTSEPSSDNLSPLTTIHTDSPCEAAEPDESIAAASPTDFFTSRARIIGVATSQRLTVLSQLAVRTRAPSRLKANHR